MWSCRVHTFTHFTLFRSRPGGPEREERTEPRSLHLHVVCKQKKKKRREKSIVRTEIRRRHLSRNVRGRDGRQLHVLWQLSYVHIWRRAETGGTSTLIH